MKITCFLAEIVSEFSGFHHSPDFKASRSTGDFQLSQKSGDSSRRSSTESTGRKHSIHITVALGEVPTVTPSDLHPHHFVKKINSSPSISRMASLSSLQEKLQRLKRTSSLENLVENANGRKMSTTSYRVMM